MLFSFVLVLPFLLFFATATITCYQNASGVSAAGVCGITEYTIGPWNFKFPLFSSFKYFALSFDVLVIFLAIVTIWGLWRSINFTRKFGEIGRPGVTLATIVLIALLFLTFIDANQHILNLLIQGGVGATLPAWTKYIAGVSAALSASVGFLGTYAVRLLEKGLEDTRWRTRILRIGTKVAITWRLPRFLSCCGWRISTSRYGVFAVRKSRKLFCSGLAKYDRDEFSPCFEFDHLPVWRQLAAQQPEHRGRHIS